MTLHHLTLSELAKLLRVPMPRLRTMLDAGHLPPGVESVELTPGGHRRVFYRPAPAVVFCGSWLLAPEHVPHAAPGHRPWARYVDDDKARRVRDLCDVVSAELVILDGTPANPRYFRAAFRQLGFTAVESVHAFPAEHAATHVNVWLINERIAGWPRTAYTVTPELELSEVKDA